MCVWEDAYTVPESVGRALLYVCKCVVIVNVGVIVIVVVVDDDVIVVVCRVCCRRLGSRMILENKLSENE